MTPLRALIAGLIALVLYGAGLFVATSFADARPHDLLPLLSTSRAPFALWCFLTAWGAIIIGALGVIAAFLAFIAPEEEDDPRFRRRGFPKAAPIVLIAVALFLAWYALHCAGAAATPIAVPVAPTAEPPVVEPAPLAGDEPLPEPAPEPPPSVAADSAAFQWTYKNPLVRDTAYVWIAEPTIFADPAEAMRLLCGKAWVAVSGSASQEGPPARNAARARARAERALREARRWLAGHNDCGPTVVLGVDLGQHVALAGETPGTTAYQRQILTISRARRASDDAVAIEAAVAELRAFLADPAQRAAFYGGRRFQAEPAILVD